MKTTERYFYGREDKLKSSKAIEILFKDGHSFSNFPFKVIWLRQETGSLQAGVGVSSRHFKKAVDRNRIKRLMREAYRLQKNTLNEQLKSTGKGLSLFIIYNGNEVPKYDLVFDKMGIIIKRLIKLIDEKTQNIP